MTTSVVVDGLLLAVVVGVLGLALLAGHVSAAVRTLLCVGRPVLPVDDRPPAGLGRLVPVGAQVDQESRRGVLALEMWLVHRRRG